MGKIITFGNEARKSMLAGIDELEKAVTSTLGPKGRTVLLDSGNRHPVVTKDGVSVARSISFSDKYKDIGASLVQEGAEKVNIMGGDGTTSSTLITAELCKAGDRLVSLNFDATDVKRGFEKACTDMLDQLEKDKHLVETEDDIKHIASISANNDEEIGQYLMEAFTTIGDGGIVTSEPSFKRDGKTFITYSTGLETGKGFASSIFINNENDESCTFDNPYFFAYNKRLESLEDIAVIFQMADQPLVIIAPAYSDTFMSDFIEKYEQNILNGIFIVPDGTDIDLVKDSLLDMATLVGATVFGGKNNKSLDKFSTADFGHAGKISVYHNRTVITGGKDSDDPDVQARIQEIKDSMNTDDKEVPKSEYEIQVLNERIAKMSGGIATIHFGAFSDIESKEKEDRYDDARNAVEHAIEDGIIIGGGCGLLHAATTVAKNHKPLENMTQERGYQEFLKVMEKPARMIIESTGKDSGYWIENIKQNENIKYGFNAKTETWSDDLYVDGVVDPVKVTKLALTYGTSIAGAFITTNCIVTSDLDNIKVFANDPIFDRTRGDLVDGSF